MNQFFSKLKKTGIDQFGMSISYGENDTVCVSILPKSNDSSVKNLIPLNLKDTIVKMDANFFDTIQKPLEETQTQFNNAESYTKALKEAASKTDVAKKQKESTSKLNKELNDMVKATDFNPIKDYEKAIKLANKILALNPEHKDAKKIVEQMSQYEIPTLF